MFVTQPADTAVYALFSDKHMHSGWVHRSEGVRMNDIWEFQLNEVLMSTEGRI